MPGTEPGGDRDAAPPQSLRPSGGDGQQTRKQINEKDHFRGLRGAGCDEGKKQ